MSEILLVTGVHREELAFGDHVAELLDKECFDVMRIAEGISHSRSVGSGGLFYFVTQHREMYLQLRQQMQSHHRLMIDLHCGLNTEGRCADIYCGDEQSLTNMAAMPKQPELAAPVRVIKIIRDAEKSGVSAAKPEAWQEARTLIPDKVWNSPAFTYVGVEIFLTREGEGNRGDWRFAADLINAIRAVLCDADCQC